MRATAPDSLHGAESFTQSGAAALTDEVRYESKVPRAVFALLLAAGGLLPPVAQAQAPRGGVLFSWVRGEGAEACPAKPELAAEVARRLGYDPFMAPFGQSLEGVVERVGPVWTVRLYTRGTGGEPLGQRELSSESADCAALADVVALAMVLAIDPDAALSAPRPSTSVAGAAQANAVAAPEPEGGEASPESPEAVRLSLGAAGSYALIPEFGVGARLGVDGPITAELRWYGAVVHWAEHTAELGDASFGIGLTTFALGLCAGTGIDGFRFDGCASVDLGTTQAVVYSPTPLAPGQRFWMSATALLRFEARIYAPLWVSVFGGITVPFVRYEYRVQGRDEVVFAPSVVSPIAGIELAVRFR